MEDRGITYGEKAVSVKILFFAQAAGWMGRRSLERDLPAPTPLGALLEDPAFDELRGHLQGTRFAVNHEFAELATRIHDGDEVAVLPPVSGG